MTEINLEKIKEDLKTIKLGPCDLDPEHMTPEKFNFYAHVNLRFDFLITTIESQKAEIEGYKAITELAVKGLKEIMLIAPMESEAFTLASKILWKMKESSDAQT